MRIISGSARGTKLYTLDGENTRPTLDRVKESLFNILQVNLQDAIVLDLFAGSGALGIESISRGARKAIFCDNNNEAIKIIEKNLNKTNMTKQATILKLDYLKALEKLKNEKIDIIYVDPPYAKNLVIPSVEKIIKLGILSKDGIIVIETDEEKAILEKLKKIENINVYDLRKYGKVKILFLNRKG